MCRSGKRLWDAGLHAGGLGKMAQVLPKDQKVVSLSPTHDQYPVGKRFEKYIAV